MQLPQDFIDSDLSLFYYTTPRSIVQLFKENKTTATGRLIFDYLMLNYSRKLNHTHKITHAQIADWIGYSERIVYKEIAHLTQIGAIRPHPDKISVYLIPCLDDLRNELHDYRLAQKEAKLQERIAERIEEMEFDLDRQLSDQERTRIEKDIRRDEAYKERQKKKRARTAAQFDLDLPFADDER